MPLVDLYMFRVMTRFSSCFMVSTALQVWEIYKLQVQLRNPMLLGLLFGHMPWMALSVDDAIIPYVCNVYTWGVLSSAMKDKWQWNDEKNDFILWKLSSFEWKILNDTASNLKWNSNSNFSVEWNSNFIEFDSIKI